METILRNVKCNSMYGPLGQGHINAVKCRSRAFLQGHFFLEPLNLSFGLPAIIPQEEQIQITISSYQEASVEAQGTSYLSGHRMREHARVTDAFCTASQWVPSRDGQAFRANCWAVQSKAPVAFPLFC